MVDLTTVELVDRDRAPAHMSPNAEAFAAKGESKLYVLTFTAVYQAAARGDRDAVAKLASIIIHEATHVEGGDERAAYAAQLEFLHHVRAPVALINGVQRARDVVLSQRPH